MSAVDTRSPRRIDGWEKVTGAATYAIDVELPNTAFGAIVRAERAHARIAEIDVEPAAEVDGVIAVMCGTDLKGIEPRFGHIIPDHPVLAIDKVRYYGEPVALVVAVVSFVVLQHYKVPIYLMVPVETVVGMV